MEIVPEQNKKEAVAASVPPQKPQPPAPVEPAVPQPEESHLAHTYEDDLDKAMNATDATVVQEMLETARTKESEEIEYKQRSVQRKWLAGFSIFFALCAVGAAAYGYLHYRTLTVPVKEAVSVGVFPSTDAVVAADTDIQTLLSRLLVDTALAKDKPSLVPIVYDARALTPLGVDAFFSYIGERASEPFARSIDSIRLGVMNDDGRILPFVILSAPDPDIAAKEFLIAEPDLLQLFYKPLNIDITAQTEEIGAGFESAYLYNLPVRTLTRTDAQTGASAVVLLYGSVTDHIIVVATEPTVLKAIYDTIIRQ